MSDQNGGPLGGPSVASESWLGLRGAVDAADLQDEQWQQHLRPAAFVDYVGQDTVKRSLLIACQAARRREEAMDHVLLYGPPGLGKTTLAKIVARELGVGFRSTSGPVFERPGELAAVLTSLEERDVLFIDEIHRLPRVSEEVLYSAMEDYAIDILIGQGPTARSVRLDLKPFTLVGATTRTGLLTSPLRDRFGLVERLSFYSPPQLEQIVLRSAQILTVAIDPEGAGELARRARGTPRIVNRLLKRVRDYAQECGDGVITGDTVCTALELLDIDKHGLDRLDRAYLEVLADKFKGGPVGIGTLAAALGEERDTIEEMCEPYLLREGLLNRTPRGRELTDLGWERAGNSRLACKDIAMIQRQLTLEQEKTDKQES